MCEGMDCVQEYPVGGVDSVCVVFLGICVYGFVFCVSVWSVYVH